MADKISSEPSILEGANKRARTEDVLRSSELDVTASAPSVIPDDWETNYNLLLAHDEAVEPLSEKLKKWVSLQRNLKKYNTLTAKQEAKLQVLVDSGVFTFKEEAVAYRPPSIITEYSNWDDCFTTLLLYGEDHCHCNIRIGAKQTTLRKKMEIDLGSWLSFQRKEKSENSLSEYHKALLQTLVVEGLFSWENTVGIDIKTVPLLDALWDRRFQAAKEYAATHNTCNVDIFTTVLSLPALTWAELKANDNMYNKKNMFDLGLWLYCQRQRYCMGVLKNDRFMKLQELIVSGHFSWLGSPTDRNPEFIALTNMKEKDDNTLWDAWFNVLLWYGRRYQHCNITTTETVTLPDNSEAELGKWVNQQRSAVKHGRLTDARVKLFLDLADQNLITERSWKDVLAKHGARKGVAGGALLSGLADEASGTDGAVAVTSVAVTPLVGNVVPPLPDTHGVDRNPIAADAQPL